MPESFDIAFAKSAVTHELIEAEHSTKLVLIQSALAAQNVKKSFAQIAVEGAWIDSGHAETIIDELNTARPESHPELAVIASSLILEATAQQAVAGDEAKRVESIRAALETLGFSRSFGELSADLGLVLVEAEPDRPARSGTKTTSRVGQTDATKRKGTDRSEQGTAQRRPGASVPVSESPAPSRGTSVRTKAPAPSRGTSVRTKAPDVGKISSGRTKAPVLPEKGAPKPAPKGPNKPLLIGLAAGVGILLIIAVVVIMNKDGTTRPIKNDSTADNPKDPPKKDPVADPPKKDPVIPDPPKPDPEVKVDDAAEQAASTAWDDANVHYREGRFKLAVVQLHLLKRTYGATRWFKANENSVENMLATAQRKAESETDPDPVVPTEIKKDLTKLKADYDRAKSSRIADGRKRLEEAKKALEADRIAEKARMADLLKRISDKKMSLVVKSGGVKLDNASILMISRDNVSLKFESDGSPVQMDIPWDALDDKSFLALKKAIHTPDGAAGWYEIGRQAITRRLWKDAKAAFDECKKLDASFADRCPNLDPIINNQGAFKGASKRIGKETLLLTWDWADEDQREDFKPAADWKVGGGTAVINPRGRSLSSIKEVEFEDEFALEVQVAIDEKAQFIIACFFNGMDQKLFMVNLGAAGATMTRWDGAEPPAPTYKKEGKITGDVAIRFSVRGGNWKVTANGTEVFSASDTTPTKTVTSGEKKQAGSCYIGAMGGPVTLKKMSVTGKVNSMELDKTFAETEVLVRRALEGDLRPRKPDDKDDRDIVISIESEWHLAQLSDDDRRDYEKAKQKIMKAYNDGRWTNPRDIFDRKESVFAYLEPVIQNNPNFRAASYWRAIAYHLLGRRDMARKDFIEAANDADCYEAQAQLAEANFDDFKFEQADHYIEQVLKMAPDYGPAIGLKCVRRFMNACDHKELQKGNVSGDVKNAMADLEVARKLDPNDDELRERQKNLLNVIKGPRHLGCKYMVETPHYFVMSDISPEKTKLYGERLEAAYSYYKETFKEFYKEDPARRKPRIAIFNTKEAFMTYGELTLGQRQQNTLGYFIYMYHELLLFEDVDLDDTLHVMYHEAFHQFMSMMIPHAPYWYNEGIAEYMGAILVEKGKVTQKARILDGRLKNLKMALRRALPFEGIMNETPGQFYSGDVSFKYAQAWSMVHFFYEHEAGKYRKLLDAYYKALLDGKEPREAYDTAFGATDLKELKKEWTAFVEKLQPEKK